VLPPELVARIDFSTLSLRPGSYVDDALSGSHSDLLFSVRVSGKPALLYVLFEHQSSPDKLMPLRLLGYIVRILTSHVDNTKAGSDVLPLPVVIPIVLHHGDSGWSAALRLEDLFDQQLVQDAGLSELIPRLRFLLDDLNHVTDDELEQRALGLLPTLTLWLLRDARSPARFTRSLGRWLAAMAELFAAPNGREALHTIFRYIALVADESLAQNLSQAVAAVQPDVKENPMTTIAEKWIADAEAKGRAIGELRGRAIGEARGEVIGEARGRIAGKADLLRKLLTMRFGELSESSGLRIASASEAELERWAERVLSADADETVDAVLGG